MSRSRVAIADDDVLLREGLASLLDRSGFDVVGQVGNGTELLALVRPGPSRPRPSSTSACRRSIRPRDWRLRRSSARSYPKPPLLVLSAHVEVEHAMQLLA